MSFLKQLTGLAFAVIVLAGFRADAAANGDLTRMHSLAEAPMLVALSGVEMNAIQGGYCLKCRIFCAVAGAAAGAATGGNPGVAVFVGLTCMELTDPEKLA